MKNSGAIGISLSWLWLMVLTVASVLAGSLFDQQGLFLTVVFFIVFLKGQQITDIFMELNHAPRFWRLLLLAYVLVLPLILLFIYTI
ncbi:cytochrome C oxidase subunit IV family protein [Thalassotalea sp. PLHSN55]|uniref:cytochrome C oxidase subunit IV family protein n=1 Tax=Thalassotalea sp. PLHSN55 TaxID=3435888 RepID=UPI003F84D017